MALTYFSYISHRWVHPVSKVYLPVSDKQFTLVSCFNHQPLATLCYRVTLLCSRSVSPSHERASYQSWIRWGGTEATGLAQQLDAIAWAFRTTEREEHIQLYIGRWWHILLTCVSVTRTNMSKATFMEQHVGKSQFIIMFSFQNKSSPLFVKSAGMSVHVQMSQQTVF